MSRDRRGESRQVLGAVRDRHEAIQKIERQMIELAELFTDMERMVVEQEQMVEQIETSAEDTHTNVQQANTELHTATNSARAARKKKWICFWIVGMPYKTNTQINFNEPLLIVHSHPDHHYHCDRFHCSGCRYRCVQEEQWQ